MEAIRRETLVSFRWSSNNFKAEAISASVLNSQVLNNSSLFFFFCFFLFLFWLYYLCMHIFWDWRDFVGEIWNIFVNVVMNFVHFFFLFQIIILLKTIIIPYYAIVHCLVYLMFFFFPLMDVLQTSICKMWTWLIRNLELTIFEEQVSLVVHSILTYWLKIQRILLNFDYYTKNYKNFKMWKKTHWIFNFF